MPEFEPGSPEHDVQRLSRLMDARESSLVTFEDYYSGKHPLSFQTTRFRRSFGELLRELNDNWSPLVISAVQERLKPEGFRLDRKVQEGDEEAWDIWQRNHLDAESHIAHTESLINSESHVLVWWKPGTKDEPFISIEHPRQMFVETQPGNRYARRAALKRWVGEDGFLYAELYRPDGVYKFRSRAAVESAVEVERTGMVVVSSGTQAELVSNEAKGERWPLPNPLRTVPVVPLYTEPRLLMRDGLIGKSEVKDIIPAQNALNELLRHMIVAAENAGFPQRHAVGYDPPLNDDGTIDFVALRDRFNPSVNDAILAENPNTRFGSFPVADLTNYVAAIENRVQSIASRTRTPPHYFYLKGAFPSGESIKSAETGLVAKTKERQVHFGEAWEEVIRLAFAVKGDTRKASVMTSEVIWGDPESRTEGEHVDAILKLQALGVPQKALWEKYGASPQEIARWTAMQEEEAALVGLAADPFREFTRPQTNGQVTEPVAG